MTEHKTTSVRLADMQAGIERRIRSGGYASASEVLRAAMRALDREEQALDEILRQKVRVALDDLQPSIPAEQVFADLRAKHGRT